MDDLRVYDSDFNLIHMENNLISSNWTVYFNSVGSFEIHTLADTEFASIVINKLDIMANKILIIVQGDLQGIVTGVRLSGDVAIYGKTCNWLLSRKIVPKFITSDLPVTRNPELVARHLVLNAFSDQPNFVLGDLVGLDDMDAFWRNTYNPLSEVVSDVLKVKNSGHSVNFDTRNKNWVFNVKAPIESKVVLSEANANAFNTEYTYSIDDYYSSCWYEKEQDFVNGEFPDPIWTKLVKDEKTGIFSSEFVSDATVESEAEGIMKGKSVKSEIVTDVYDLLFGTDYNLGDILRVQYVNGTILRTDEKQISGISLGWENGSESRKIILRDI